MWPRVGVAIASFLVVGRVLAQDDLAGRIGRAPDGPVALTFAARPDVCGNGFSYLRVGLGGPGESDWVYAWSEGGGDGRCLNGPVRVVLTRLDRRITGVRVGIGPVRLPAGTTDLGVVGAPGAAQFLVDLAGRTDGRAGRDALTAAALADSADTWRGLLALARNPGVSRGLRESAANWLGRDLGGGRELVDGLLALARDVDAPGSVRSRAVVALGRIQAEVEGLIALAGLDDPVVARPALTALGRSPDPRARALVRRAARDSLLPRPVRAEALKALGGRDATPADLAALRELWPVLETDLKRTALQLVAETGGADNARWLLGVARSNEELVTVRAEAVRLAEQAGIGSAELSRVYDEAADRRVKEATLDALQRIGDRTARAKIGSVAQADTDPQLRRAAVTRLARDGDRRARELLEGVVTKP